MQQMSHSQTSSRQHRATSSRQSRQERQDALPQIGQASRTISGLEHRSLGNLSQLKSFAEVSSSLKSVQLATTGQPVKAFEKGRSSRNLDDLEPILPFIKPAILESMQADNRSDKKRSHSSLHRSRPSLTKEEGAQLNQILNFGMNADLQTEDAVADQFDGLQVNQELKTTADIEAQEISARKAALRQQHQLVTESVVTQHNNLLGSNKTLGSQKGSLPGSHSSSRQKKKQRVNQFKATRMTQQEVIEFLFEVGKSNVSLNSHLLPTDLNSTSAIDSFLEAVDWIISNNVQKRPPELFDGIHLSTGTRTAYAHEVLHYLIKHQAKEAMFLDAVEFFTETMQHVLEVERQNEERRLTIEALKEKQEELTTKWFDLERMLVETSTNLLKLRQSEHEQAQVLLQTKRHLEAKKAECDSLLYRLKIVTEEATNSRAKLTSPGPLSRNMSEIQGNLVLATTSDHEIKAQDQQTKQRAELIEVQDFPEQLRDSQGTFQHLQEQLNAFQIKNRALLDENGNLRDALANKEKLTLHLEEKVSQIMMEQEHQAIQFKSEIILHQQQQKEADLAFRNKLIETKQQVELDAQATVKEQIRQLEEKLKLEAQTISDQATKNMSLTDRITDLQSQFQAFKEQKQTQESQRVFQNELTEIKLAETQKKLIDIQTEMQQQIDHYESQADFQQKQNQALYLRVKYLRQSADVLLRQKGFLLDTLQKQQDQLTGKMTQLETSMLNQNKSKSYLVSVEKAVKQARSLADLGSLALTNIAQIVKFFKVEKMHSLIFETEAPDALLAFEETAAYELQHRTEKTEESAKLKMQDSAIDGSQSQILEDGEVCNLEKVQRMLQTLYELQDLPVNFRPKEEKRKSNVKAVKHDEQYYLEQMPVALISTCLKFVVAVLHEFEIVQGVEEIPDQIGLLMIQASEKTDKTIENEIFDKFLSNSSQLISREIKNWKEQIQTVQSIRELNAPKSPRSPKYFTKKLVNQAKQEETQNSLNIQKVPLESSLISHQTPSSEQETNIKLLNLKLQETKEHSHTMQKALANKIVKLEETVDFLKETQDQRLAEAEAAFKQELDTVQASVKQREKQLLALIQQLQVRNEQLELSDYEDQPARKIVQEQPVKRSASQLSKQSRQMSQQSLKEQEAVSMAQLNEIDQKLRNYQENVAQYLNIREQTMGIISVVFEQNASNSMATESILLYYLAKCLSLPKDKIRILERSDFVHDSQSESHLLHKPNQKVMTKFALEIVQDQSVVQQLLLKLKTEINDGSSLLFDLSPSYLCIGLGHSGLMTKSKLVDMTLMMKQGKQIHGQDYIMSLLRARDNPYVFMVLCQDLQNGREYALELRENDVFQLIEGDQGMLEDPEPLELFAKIINSLEFVQKDGVTYLTCEQVVFFNSLWADAMVSAASSSIQAMPRNHLQASFDATVSRVVIDEPDFRKTSYRDAQLFATEDYAPIRSNYRDMLYQEAESQTPFAIGLLYEPAIVIYDGVCQIKQEVSIGIVISEMRASSTLVFEFSDQKLESTSTTRFTMCQASLPDSNDLLSDMTATTSAHQYMLHCECLRLEGDKCVLICVERLHSEGFLIKCHDLQLMQSEELVLVRGPAGKLTNISDPSNLVYNDEFRDLVFDVAHAQRDQTQAVMQENVSSLQNRMLRQGLNQAKAMTELFTASQPKKQQTKPAKTKWFFAASKVTEYQSQETKNQDLVNGWKGCTQKGMLLYRDTTEVRCDLNQSGTFINLKSLVSFHQKEESVHIEVYLYTNKKPMTITSVVSSLDLFGCDTAEIQFSQRLSILQNLTEKLFILQDGSSFHMKVETEAEPMSAISERLRKEQEEQKDNADEGRRKSKFISENYQQFMEDKIDEIRRDKDALMKADKLKLFQEIVTLEDQVYDMKIYVSVRNRKDRAKTPSKRIVTFNKSTQQILQQKIEHFIDEIGDFEFIYMETFVPVLEELAYCFIDKKILSYMLSCDITCDYQQLILQWQMQLIPYLFRHSTVEILSRKIIVRNKTDIQELLLKNVRSQCGGKVIQRKDNSVVAGFSEEHNGLLKRTLVLNQEVDFTEQSYDIKLYKIAKASLVASGELDLANETAAFHLEVFNLADPEVMFKYCLPAHQMGSNSHDPVTFIVDLFNLVDHPFGQKNKEEPSKRYQSLFRKYIDNQLMLVIQETKFPATIGLMLTEPTSRLTWKFTYEVQTEIVNPAGFALVDQATLERFMTVVFDSSQQDEQQVLKTAEVTRLKGEWHDTEKEDQVLYAADIDSEVSVLVDKYRQNLRVQVIDRDEQSRNQTSRKQFEAMVKGEVKKQPRPNTDDFDERQSSAQMSEITLDLRMIKVRGTSFFAKMITFSPQSNGGHWAVDSEHNLILTLQVRNNQVVISLIRLIDLKPLVRVEYEHENPKEDDVYTTAETLVNQVNELYDVQAHLLDVIRHMHSQRMEEVVLTNYQTLCALNIQSTQWRPLGEQAAPNSGDDFEASLLRLSESFSVSSRFYQRHLQQMRTLTLHRKVFFDEIKEKLIIINANVSVEQDKEANQNFAKNDINQFTFMLIEPESGKQSLMDFQLQHCISAKQLDQLNRKDLTRLKQVAKAILEERSSIKRREDVPNPTDGDYMLEILPEAELMSESSLSGLPRAQDMMGDPVIMEEVSNEDMSHHMSRSSSVAN